ncbi:MAG: efflux RND transporter permease subunit [Granulosicoccus sp.]
METLFFRQPRLSILAILVIVVAGLSAFLSIGRQEDPTITNLFATITTPYPGAEPGRVESLVTEKIEAELRQIASIGIIESSSASGISIISVELIETLTDSDIQVAWSDVRDALDDAERELPEGVQPIELATDNAGTFSSIVALVPSDGMSIASTARYAQNLADRLRSVSGTDKVDLFGDVSEEILIEIDIAALSVLGVSVEQVSQAVRSADTRIRAGRLRSDTANFVIELSGEINTLDRVQQLPVVINNGSLLRIGDIATVSKGIRQPSDEMALSAGQPAVLVGTRISNELQIDVWMRDIRTVLDEFERNLPRTLTLERVFDQSIYTKERLQSVSLNMAVGVSLVVLILLVTLGLRAAMIVALVLPLVTLATVATMNLMGLAIQQMSLTGLIVALGLLVDAAIVMTDEIRRRLQNGFARSIAVGSSVKRLFAPLLASTVTTALSFMPMVLLPGPSGDFVGSIALALIIMLGWSFIIAITITASMAGHILPEKPRRSLLDQGVSIPTISNFFRRTLDWSIEHPVNSIAFALVLPLMGFLSAGTLTAQFFPGVDRNQFHVEVELEQGSSLAKTHKTVQGIDTQLREATGITQVSWVIGKSAPAFYYNMVGERDREPQYAQALVTTQSSETTASLVPLLQSELSATFPGSRIIVRDLVQGPPVDAPVELRIVGENLDVLREEGVRLRAMLSEVELITEIRTSLDGGAPKVVFNMNEESARLSGLTISGVAQQLETTLEGHTGGFLLDGGVQLPLRVRVSDQDRGDVSVIQNLPLLAQGLSSIPGDYKAVPLANVSRMQLQPAQSAISRRNGERVNTVQAFVRYGSLPEEALKQVRGLVEESGFELPEGYRLQIGGDSDARNNTLNNLIAPLGIIITLTIAAIVLTFNSFRLALVIAAVSGLSAGLSLLALAVFQYPFGINALIGVIGSIGVSINAAIVILTGLQKNEAASAGDQSAIVQVVMDSSRHIVSTTVTTFAGFLPLILEGGGFWPPFAMSVAGGVLLSTVVSFYFTPPVYRLIQKHSLRRKKPKPSALEEVMI